MVAWENQRARLNQALGIRPADCTDGAYCALPQAPVDGPSVARDVSKVIAT